MTIKNPVEWGYEQLRTVAVTTGAATRQIRRTENARGQPVPEVRRISIEDLQDALTAGIADFAANRTDVLFVCVMYPVVGLILARMAFGYEMLPLLFPLASGFALVGPFAAIGLYEMSRRREQGATVTWADALGVFRSPSIGPIVLLGLILMAIFVLWMFAAAAIYQLTLGPEPPASLGTFAHDVLMTPAGWALIVIGVGVGFLFAVIALSISVVSFSLMLDRNVGLETAVWTSVRAVAANPLPMAAWGLIVATGLVAGSIPLLLGLIVVMPVLGHATWHLYRKVVPR